MATYEVKIYELISHNLEIQADSEDEVYGIAHNALTMVADVIIDERIVDYYNDSEGFTGNYSIVKVSD